MFKLNVEIKYVKWIGNHYNLAYFEWKICKVEDKIILNDKGNLKIDKYWIFLSAVYSGGSEENKKLYINNIWLGNNEYGNKFVGARV